MTNATSKCRHKQNGAQRGAPTSKTCERCKSEKQKQRKAAQRRASRRRTAEIERATRVSVLRQKPRRKPAQPDFKVMSALLEAWQASYSRHMAYSRYLPLQQMIEACEKDAALTLHDIRVRTRMPVLDIEEAIARLIRFSYVKLVRGSSIRYVILHSM